MTAKKTLIESMACSFTGMSIHENGSYESNDLVVNDERSENSQKDSIDSDSKNKCLLPTTTNSITNDHNNNNENNKKCKKLTINEFPNEILSMVIHKLSNDNSARKLWSLRRVSRQWKYVIHQVLYEKVKYRLTHSSPTSVQLYTCQITESKVKYSDSIRVHITGYDKETGEMMLRCQQSQHFSRVNKKTKLFLVVRRKTPVIMRKGIINNNVAEPNNNENITLRTEECKEPLRDGKHVFYKENSFKIEYELKRNYTSDAIITKAFEKCLSVLSVVVSPILVLETAISI
ncbi:10554_t:CDS:1 [Ambispora leptoticha]|uniref:10554_t:CDS:1 n=1 Tax=Ambispora leptoticha TaxID=144679 RepID=A0A9N9BXU0_9GLOM|nr:10554_t:CDS:1 [Ambispora leptoticha]